MRKFRNPLIFASSSVFLAALPAVAGDGDPLPETLSPEPPATTPSAPEKSPETTALFFYSASDLQSKKTTAPPLSETPLPELFAPLPSFTVAPATPMEISTGPANPEISTGVPRHRSTSGTASDLPPTEKTLQLRWLSRLLKYWNQLK
ncbi:hypothetical protein U1Q18_043328 [Sarracenia purpurea var. burkii]